jgi:hypothetical protein
LHISTFFKEIGTGKFSHENSGVVDILFGNTVEMLFGKNLKLFFI